MTEFPPGDEPPVYFDPQSQLWVYRASALSHCSKSLVAMRTERDRETEINQWFQRALDEGRRNEPIILRRLYGGEGSVASSWHPVLDQRQREIEIPVGRTAVIRGHVDDIATNGAETVVVEVKALGKGFMEAYREHGVIGGLPYNEQISAYMHGTGLPCLVVMGEKNPETKLVYRVYSTLIHTPPVSLAALKLKVMRVEAAAERGELPKECDGKRDFCPFPSLHVNWDTVEEAAYGKIAQAAFDQYWSNQNRLAWEKNYKADKAKLEGLIRAAGVTNFRVEIEGDRYEVVERSSERWPLKADQTGEKKRSVWWEVKKVDANEKKEPET